MQQSKAAFGGTPRLKNAFSVFKLTSYNNPQINYPSGKADQIVYLLKCPVSRRLQRQPKQMTIIKPPNFFQKFVCGLIIVGCLVQK
jgi:hypothetical protein